MGKTIIISVIAGVVLVFLFVLIKPSFTGNVIAEEKTKLGYCPTMQEEAEKLAIENNYELINLGSAAGALQALKNNQIDKALIGRKAERNEINSDTQEIIIKSGYTLVSNKKGFIDYSTLASSEVYTSLEMSFNFPVKRISEKEVLEKINQGKNVLISWEDWKDEYGLVVVMNGNKKVKYFRGAFLYEN